MAVPVGWTDIDTPSHRLVWLHPSHDPADADSILPYIPRLTSRRKHRAARVMSIGNMQYPPTAYIMFEWGREILMRTA